MDTFTFAAGNRRVLLRTPLYLVGALGAVVVPRTSQLWVFGSGIGLGEGALALYELARERIGDDVRLVWLAGSPAELDGSSAPRLRCRGPPERVGVLADAAGPGARRHPRPGRCEPLRRVGWIRRPALARHPAQETAPGLPGRARRRRRPAETRGAGRPADWGTGPQEARSGCSRSRRPGSSSASPAVSARPGNASSPPVTRATTSCSPARPASAATGPGPLLAATVGALPEAAYLVLYAPTWRDGAVDPGAPDEAAWDEIAHWLEADNAVLVVRNHPLGRADYAAGPARSDRIRLLDARAMADVTPVLSGVDALITDYSSIAFDFALVGGTDRLLRPRRRGVRPLARAVRAVPVVRRRPAGGHLGPRPGPS